MAQYVFQLPEWQLKDIREKLEIYFIKEGFTKEEINSEIETIMDSKIDDVDWRNINSVVEFQRTLEIVRKLVNQMYCEAHEIAKTKSGDEHPSQFLQREQLEIQLTHLIVEQVNQNK